MPTDYDLSRRKILGTLGTIGGAAALGGTGTFAFFSDDEEFANNQVVAGSLDMKAAYSAHYSDWSPDEDGSDTSTPDDDVEVVMFDGAPGEVGDRGDLSTQAPGKTGLPANDAWLIAVDDPEQFLINTQRGGDGDASCPNGTDAEDLEQPVIRLKDVKPGDFGEVTFDLALCDNPGYIWFQASNATASDNGHSEPEVKDKQEEVAEGPEGETVELLDVVQAAYWVDDGDNYQDGGEEPASVGSLRDILSELSAGGVALDGDIAAESAGGTGEQGCFSEGITHSMAFAWWVPIDHGNEIQTDSVEFSLNFYTEQCRHNNGELNPLQAFLNDDALFKDEPWNGMIEDRTGMETVPVEVGSVTDVQFGPFSDLPVAFSPQVIRVEAPVDVEWTWSPDPGFPPIPHDVHSLEDGLFHHHLRAPPAPGNPPITETTSFGTGDKGIHLYYCTPHGAPHFVHSSPGAPIDEALNEFGMRGAIIVE